MSSNQGINTKIPLDSSKIYPRTWHTTQEQLVRDLKLLRLSSLFKDGTSINQYLEFGCHL